MENEGTVHRPKLPRRTATTRLRGLRRPRPGLCLGLEPAMAMRPRRGTRVAVPLVNATAWPRQRCRQQGARQTAPRAGGRCGDSYLGWQGLGHSPQGADGGDGGNGRTVHSSGSGGGSCARKDGEAESKREKESTTAAHWLPRAEENNGGGELFTAERKMGWRGGARLLIAKGRGGARGGRQLLERARGATSGGRRDAHTVGAGEPGG
jgi:hypothetical protein